MNAHESVTFGVLSINCAVTCTYIHQWQGTTNPCWWYSKDVLQLCHHSMGCRCCCVSPYQRFRQVCSNKSKLYQTQYHLYKISFMSKSPGSCNKNMNHYSFCGVLYSNLNKTSQNSGSSCNLHTVWVPCCYVHLCCDVGPICFKEIIIWSKSLRHTTHHDAEHSKSTWIQRTIATHVVTRVKMTTVLCLFTYRWRYDVMFQRRCRSVLDRGMYRAQTQEARKPVTHMPYLWKHRSIH